MYAFLYVAHSLTHHHDGFWGTMLTEIRAFSPTGIIPSEAS